MPAAHPTSVHDGQCPAPQTGPADRSGPAASRPGPAADSAAVSLCCLVHVSRQRSPLIFPRQRAEELDDEVDVRVRQVTSELNTPHDLDGLRQRGSGAIVEIGSGDGHIAEAGNAEHKAVALDPGYDEATEVGVADAGPTQHVWIVEDAELLQQIASDIDALMASDAAVGFEQLVTVFLFGADGIALAI